MQPISILDHVSAQRAISARFRPKSPAEVLTLRLSQRLGDAASAAHYASLLARYSEAQVLLAYRRTQESGIVQVPGRHFHKELLAIPASASDDHNAKLLALRLERRAIAAALFSGDRLEYTQVRQLSSARNKALSSTIGFVNWLCEQYSPDSAAIEVVAANQPVQRRALAEAVMGTLRGHALPLWEIDKSQVFAGFGQPALRNRRELRQVITEIWPVLSNTGAKRLIADAVALGLYVQVERCFLH
jgi:hypothetical protein